MKKLFSIILAWWYWITNKNNELAQERLVYCAVCPHRKGFTCGVCSCVLKAKARLPEETCPKGVWKK